MHKHRNKLIIFVFLALQLISSGFINYPTIALLISSGLTLIIALYLYHDHLKMEWSRLMNETTIKRLFLLSFGLFILNIMIRIGLLQLLNPWINLENLAMNQQLLEEMQKAINPILFTLFTVISAPIVEELIFREAMNAWVPHHRRWLIYLMWIISTFLFAGAHVFTVQDFIIYLPLAITLLWVYVKFDRNVTASIFFHLFNNAIAVLMMYLTQLIPEEMLQQAAGFILSFLN